MVYGVSKRLGVRSEDCDESGSPLVHQHLPRRPPRSSQRPLHRYDRSLQGREPEKTRPGALVHVVQVDALKVNKRHGAPTNRTDPLALVER